VTNSLPTGNFSYVQGQTVITEPGPVTRSGTNADPDLIINGTNLVWDFSTLATPCAIDHVLISEVYYNDSHTAAENKNGYQWVELFNPTAAPITLDGCSLKDAVSGVYDDLPTMTLAAGEFVIVAGSTNAFNAGHAGYTGQVFEVGGTIGNGLNDYGDGVFLYQGATLIDGMSYGNSQAAFTTPCELTLEGRSLARSPAANRDTGNSTEWATLPSPTPGSGDIPLGLQTGGGVTIIYKVAGSCSADTGIFSSKAGYEQPPGTPAPVATTTKSIALYAGDLLVSETPLMQNASRYGPAAWLVSVKNLGLGSARNVVITDRLSSGFQFTGSDVAPASTAVGADTVMTWDKTVIPGLADLAPDATISLAVTGRVALVTNLYNKADVQWGCTTSTVCQSSATASNTITAGINLVDLVPRLAAWLTPVAPIPVSYCAGTTVTLHITNAAGPTVGTAFDVAVSNILPSSLIGTNQIYVGDLPSGASTNVAITLLAGGGCPISTNAQTAYFTFSYHDSMDRPYGPPTVFSVVQVTQPPSASVQVSVPASQTSTEGGAIPVEVYFTYNNFDGTELITLRETYPASTNLTPTAISAGGYLDGTDVVWTNTGFIGSGVYTASFNLAIGSLCGGPFGYIQNRVTVPDFTNCRGCTTPVTGSGESYLTYFGAGAGCVTGGGGGGGTGICTYASIKTAPTNNLVEVCQPVFLSHSFTNFTGILPSWSNMTFTSDLGGETGDAVTNDVTVWVNGSNLTAFCTMSDVVSLTVNLSGLTNSLYPDLSVVTNLTITWLMQTIAAGQVHETSTLHVPVCGGAWAEVYWNVGASDMAISLNAIEYLEACGITTGRIDLVQLSSPGLMSGSNAVFASYDVRVTLDLDADGNGASEITYEDGSTVFSNMVLLGGAPTNGFNPVISGKKLIWTIGDLDPNGAGSISYILRGACSRAVLEKQAAKVEFNTHCAQGQAPLATAWSQTNAVPTVCPAGRMSVEIQPEVTFLTETQYVVRMSFMNTGAGTAYNVTPELITPTNVVFNSASIAPTNVAASTSIVWTLQYPSNPGNLIDADGDGNADDLAPLGQFEILATNSILSFGQNAVHARVAHGCNGNTCQSATSVNATFESNAGALAARTAFDANGELCNTNAAKIIILNTGLIKDYDIHVFEVLPDGMTYVAGSSRYVYGGVTTNALMDPTGDGTSGNKLNWGSAQIPTLAGLPAGGELTILFSTLASCAANAGNKQYSTSATYVDIGRNLNSVAAVSTIQVLDIPALSVVVGASHIVVDHNRTNIYTLTVDHSAGSIVDVPAMQLVDILPTGVNYLGASVEPDLRSGQTLTWNNATLMGLSGGAPYTPAKAAISITVTGLVLACNYIDNNATVSFGCDTGSLCLNSAGTQRSISIPLVAIGDQSALTLTSWGGTRTVVVTNTGATGRGVIITNIAPSGFVFTSVASVSGEFTGEALTVQLGGTPSGKTALIDFTTAATSGAVDGSDDAEDGADNLDMGNGKGFVVTFNLISDGSGMDTVANPLDVGYADPEPVVLSEVTAPATLIYSNLCEEMQPQTVNQSEKTIPVRPDPDIDLLPHSLIVTNGQNVTFTLSVINAADAGYSTNLHVRLKFGEGWSNLTCLSTNLSESGAGTVQMEMLGNTNVLIELPGVALNTTLNNLAMTFQATAVQGAGPLYALAEVVGKSPVTASIAYIGTNTLGEAPLLNTMQGVAITTNSGTYYGFDQVKGFGAGFEVNGAIRYAADGSPLVNELSARIGEPLKFHIVANFFGTAYSNIVLTQSREAGLVFGTPVNYVLTGGITNAVYDAEAGTFTLQPMLVDTSALSSFTVDVPVWAANNLDNQDGVSITNVIIPTFTVAGVTNLPPNSTNIVHVIEPTLTLTMVCDTNNIQAGDEVTFTNVISGGGSCHAYDVEFVDTLPAGMTFTGVTQVGPGSVVGSVFRMTSGELAGMADLATGASLTIIVKAKVMNQLVGSTISNVATIYYTSLAGPSTDERDGSDGAGLLNDYTATASVGVLAMPLTGINKSVGSSSQDNTAAPDLTIGERILYTIRVDVPNGVSTNLQVTDHLPPGLDWVGDNPAAGLAYPGKGYQFVIPEGGPVFSTNVEAGLTISDPDETADSSLTADGAGQAVRFTIAVITNTPDSPAPNDYFDLSLECVVVDDGANNIGKTPSQKSWSNQVTVIDGFSTNATNSLAYTIAEPDVKIGHTLSPTANLDAGDLVTITLYVTNSAAARANAYDVRVLDTLPLACFDVNTLVWEAPETGWAVTTNVNGANLEYRFASTATTALLTNSVVTNRFTVRLAQGVTPSLIISNAVQLEASDTINGTPPEGIPSRSTTSAKTYLSLTVTNLTVAKSFVGTSETNLVDSVGQKVQIGETVTYQLDVTLPEGTVSNLMVTDLIPAGMLYVTNRVVTNTFTGSLGSPLGVIGGASGGAAVSFVFSNDTVVTSNNLTGDNAFTIFVDAVVLNVAGNGGTVAGSQTMLTNKSAITFAANPLAIVTNASVIVTNIEPKIRISTSFSTNRMDAGDLVTVSLVVSNTGLATAYDLVVTDALNTVYFNTNTISNFKVNGVAGEGTGYLQTLTNGMVWIASDAVGTNPPACSLETNEVITFTFDVTAAQTLPPNMTITNRVGIYADTIAGYALYQRTVTGLVATATNQSLGLTVAKSFVGTSETNAVDSVGQKVQIGETVTYQLDVTLPEGTVSNLVVTDLIPAGMLYVTNRVVTNTFTGSLGSPLGVIGGASSGAAVSFVFSNDTVVTSNNLTGDNGFTIFVDAVVLNVGGNAGTVAGSQTMATNKSAITFAANPLAIVTNVSVIVTNIEPKIWISTSFSTNRMDAGDPVTVSLVVSNTGLATAYDLVVTDALNTVYFNTNTISNFKVNGVAGAGTGYLQTLTNGMVWIASDAVGTNPPTCSLETNEVITFTFDVTAAQTVPPNMTITNRVGIYADTIAGYALYQRTVTGLVATATNQSPNVGIDKTFDGTSETNTVDSTNQFVQVGEIVTYKLLVTLPEGTISNLVVMDLMPRGMQYVTNRIETNTFVGVLGSPMGVVGGGSGAPVSFVFSNNTVVTSNNIAGDNLFAMYVDAVVLNTNINFGTAAGTQTFFTNKSVVSFAGNALAAVTNSAVMTTNVEPVIAISKAFSTNVVDAGDVVTVTLVVTNTGLATAFDLVVTDAVNAVYFDTNNSVASFTVNGLAPTGYVMRAINGGLQIVSDTSTSSEPTNSLEVHEGIVFRYQMTAAQTVPPNTSVTLVASFQADTMAGAPAEQRIVSAVNASASVAIPNIVVIKSLAGTSLTHEWESAATNLQIGEVATYLISVTMPEGTVSNLVVTDLIPAGMRYVAYRVLPPAQMTLGTAGLTGGTGDGVPAVLTLSGNTLVGSDNNSGNNTLGIEVDARVLDVPLNRGRVGQQTVFTNEATAAFSGPGANTMTSLKVYTYAVEPSLKMLKTMSGPVNGLVTVTLVVTNEGLATAYDVVVTDRFDAVYFDTTTLANTLLPDGFTFASSGAPGSATITLMSEAGAIVPTNAILAGATKTFAFTLQSILNAGQSITNVAFIISNSTLSGVSADERVEPVVSGTNALALPMSTITKTVTSPVGRAADVGETISYVITVTNLGSMGMGTVLVTDEFPTNYITYLNATPAPQTYLDGGTLIWSNVGPLAVGGGTNIAVNFTALHNTYPGVMTNLVSSAVQATNGASPVVILGSVTNAIVPSYALSKTVLFPVDRSAVTSGPAIFMMTVTNSGDVPLASIQLVDTYDAGVLQYSTASPTPNSTNSGTFTWNNIGGLPVGGTASVTGNFVALTSTGSGKTINTVMSLATFQGIGLTTARTNAALLQVAAPVGYAVVMTNPVPDGSNITFQINTISGAVYHVISVSNNIDHPFGQNWRHMVTWSNMPSWVTYTDSNVVAEVSNTRFYQIVWEEAGVTQTNPVMYEAFVQNLTTGWWHELSMPVECFDYELNKTLGDKLKVGLRGDNVDGDLLYALRQDGVWQNYQLNGANKWVRDGSDVETTDRISPNVGYWVKRQVGGVSTNIEYAGPVRLTSETNTFLPGAWKMISWPFPRSRREGFASHGTDIGWGFATAGAHGDINWPNADRLYVKSGLETTILYMRPDGRWYRVGTSASPASDVRLEHGVGYYYYHSGTGFSWAAESPVPNSNWWQ
jgi:uncharacterized repeat protein (TIGR01451 family)